MLLQLTLHAPAGSTDASPASVLGHLLHKHPEKCQTFDLPFGRAHVFYSETTEARCTAALLLDVDPVDLARGRTGAPENRPLWPYVNDRPYVASSFLCTALSRVFGTALSGRCEKHPEAAASPHDLEAALPAVSIGPTTPASFVEALFAPLGYSVEVGEKEAGVVGVRLRGVVRLTDLLSQLYVLLPVLDREKHYFVDDREVDKLLRHGEGWLAGHPQRDVIVRRYLKYHRGLCRDAFAALAERDAAATGDPQGAVEPTRDELAAEIEPGDAPAAGPADALEARTEAPLRLDDRRREAVLAALRARGARRVVDLGCGEGKLLRALLADAAFTEIVGVDVAPTVLTRAADRLKLDRLPEARRSRITLLQGSAVYRDDRLRGRDAVVCVEVIEHIDPDRLDAFRDALFGHLRPPTAIVTTPNAEYNVLFREAGLRHADHRFEWTRAEFEAWAGAAALAAGYAVRFEPIGDVDPTHGAPTQMAIFTTETSWPGGPPPGVKSGQEARPGAAASVDPASEAGFTRAKRERFGQAPETRVSQQADHAP